jgi:hypothetical protein
VSSRRADALAAEFEAANELFAVFLERLSPEEWRAVTKADDEEIRPVAVVALHVAEAHLNINARVMALAAGGEVPRRRPELFAERNARHAAANPDPDQAETIDLLRRNGALVAARFRALSNEELDRPGEVSGEPATAETEFSGRQMNHVRSHFASIRGKS